MYIHKFKTILSTIVNKQKWSKSTFRLPRPSSATACLKEVKEGMNYLLSYDFMYVHTTADSRRSHLLQIKYAVQCTN